MKKSRKIENEKIAETSGATTLVAQTGGISLTLRREEQAKKSPFLPYLAFGNPKSLLNKDYTLAVIKDNVATITDVPEITSVFSSEMVRKTEGDKYTTRLYGHLPRQKEEYAEALADIKENGNGSAWQLGAGHLVFMVKEKTFATWEGFFGMDGYVTELLWGADINKNQKVKILLQDHKKNLTKSKAGYFYLAGWNLKPGLDFQIEVLTAEDQEMIRSRYDEQIEQIDRYMK